MNFDNYQNNPRSYFVNTLIQKISDLENMIFIQRVSVVQIFPAMKGIIMMLNKDAQKDLMELYKKIEQCQKNRQRYDKDNSIPEMYGELLRYLHTGYLKEVNYIKPRFGDDGAGDDGKFEKED